jgi:putative hydrolase of the HAD superfamily
MYYAADLGLLKDSPDFFTKIEHLVTHDFGDVSAAGPPLFFDDRQQVVDHAREAGWDAHLYQQVSDVTDHPRLKLK